MKKFILVFLFLVSFNFAQTTINGLPAQTTIVNGDYLPMWNTASSLTHKITWQNLVSNIRTSNQSITGAWTFTQPIGGNISGNAGTVTNGLYSTGSYSDPTWLTRVSATKVHSSFTELLTGFAGDLTIHTGTLSIDGVSELRVLGNMSFITGGGFKLPNYTGNAFKGLGSLGYVGTDGSSYPVFEGTTGSVDTLGTNKWIRNNAVMKTGDQTVTGNKTFSGVLVHGIEVVSVGGVGIDAQKNVIEMSGTGAGAVLDVMSCGADGAIVTIVCAHNASYGFTIDNLATGSLSLSVLTANSFYCTPFGVDPVMTRGDAITFLRTDGAWIQIGNKVDF